MIGKLVGHYRILDKIGAGAMGEVYRARDERLGREVALKLIRPEFSDKSDHLRRFQQEAQTASLLNHPNILAIFDVGVFERSPYIVSELLVGKTLGERLIAGPFSVRDATAYTFQISQGLIAAHNHHIIHRDLKPDNIFLTNDGHIKILDFGVAKLQAPPSESVPIESAPTVTKHGMVIGTVAYMSPEQLRGKTIDHRSDIFSVGAILYEMLSGRRAFRGETEVDTMTAVLREEPGAAELDQAAIPAAYQDIVRHCLEKEPENRFQSAKDLAFALQTLSGSGPVKTVPYFGSKTKRTTAVAWTIAAVLAIATILLAVTYRTVPPPPTHKRLTFEAGTVYSARFVPDGQSIIYAAAWNNGPIQLYSTVGNSLMSQPLNFTNSSLLAISKSNELALVMGGSRTGLLETVNGMLADAPLAGGSPHEILSDVRWADWDAKGNLAAVHYVGGHSQLEYPIGTVLYQSAGSITNVRFSPRGDSIAFMDHPALWDNRGTVRLTDLSGHVRTLSSEWESMEGLAWRPDGKEIWFSAAAKGTDLNLMAVDLSGKGRMLLDLPVAVTLEDIASDGRVLVSLNSRRLGLAFAGPGQKEDIDLSWHDWNSARDISRDGQYVLFEDASEAAGPAYAVVIRKVDGTLPVRLGEGSAGGISPDGKWAVSVSTSQAPQITLLPIGPGQPRSLAVSGLDHIHNGWARFLPAGQAVEVIGDSTGHAARCYMVELSNGKAKAVTPEGVHCGPPTPDGQYVIGSAPDRTLAMFPVGGGSPRPIPHLENSFVAVQWSDDGSALYGYHRGEIPAKIYRFEIATGKETVIRQLKPAAPAGIADVAPVVVNHDATSFAYSYNETLSSLYLISGLH
jgi:serine/threonine protein kinase